MARRDVGVRRELKRELKLLVLGLVFALAAAVIVYLGLMAAADKLT